MIRFRWDHEGSVPHHGIRVLIKRRKIRSFSLSTTRGWPSATQGERSHQTPTLTAAWSWTFPFPELWEKKKNVYCLSHPVYSILFEQANRLIQIFYSNNLSSWYFHCIIAEVWKLMTSSVIFEKVMLTEFNDAFQSLASGIRPGDWTQYLSCISSQLVFTCSSISLPPTTDMTSWMDGQNTATESLATLPERGMCFPAIKTQSNSKDGLWLS